jgi:hypothetical protein
MKYHYDKHQDTKHIISFLVLLLAFSCLGLFWQYRNDIFASGSFNLFITLVAVALGLFVGLLYLLSKESKVVKVKATKSKKKK